MHLLQQAKFRPRSVSKRWAQEPPYFTTRSKLAVFHSTLDEIWNSFIVSCLFPFPSPHSPSFPSLSLPSPVLPLPLPSLIHLFLLSLLPFLLLSTLSFLFVPYWQKNLKQKATALYLNAPALSLPLQALLFHPYTLLPFLAFGEVNCKSLVSCLLTYSIEFHVRVG